MQPSPIKVGVIGYGGAFNMGRQHLQEMQAAGMIPTAVAELDPQRLAVATRDYPGIEAYATTEEMLEKSSVDLLTVITPHNTHARLGLLCLAAGKHCILEKPMAITTAECDSLIAAAKTKNLVVSTYHNRHWDGWILKALEVAGSGILGKIVRVELRMGVHSQPKGWWRSSRSISGGILYDWGVHLLEYALQIIDSELTEVSGYAWEGHWAGQPGAFFPDDSNEDEAQLVARFASGQRINLMLTSLDVTPKSGHMEIVGTQGTHLIDIDKGSETSVALPDDERKILRSKNPASQGYKFYENIAAHLTSGEPLIITGEWSRRPIHILDLAVQSAKQGKALPAVYP